MKINEIQEGSDREYLSLPKEDIERLRAKFLPDWEYKDNSLQKRYKFEDYFEVIKFLINTVKPQEKLDHHADLGVFYDEVLVKIYTHRTKDVSDYDFMVAMQMDMIAKKMHGAINPEYGLDSLVDEGTRCWKGYTKKGMKTMFGKRVNNCVKNEEVDVCVNCGELVFAESLNENLKKWFKDKWVRFGPDGKIRGDCARGSSKEGKPKCLPRSKANALGKKGRKSAASRKRRQDPKKNRRGKAKNVATKKK
jgi:pterin-4a-carbinolamine dehydratase|tara:strand:+ start:39 stop:788 length:750 start_codon:yes stop_codon:yes gene_type:complete